MKTKRYIFSLWFLGLIAGCDSNHKFLGSLASTPITTKPLPHANSELTPPSDFKGIKKQTSLCDNYSLGPAKKPNPFGCNEETVDEK